MKRLLSYIHKLMIILIMYHLSACEMIKTDKLDADFDKLIKSLEKSVAGKSFKPYEKSQLSRAKLLQSQIDKLIETMNHRPELKGQMSEDVEVTEKFVKDNGHKLYSWHAQFETRISLITDLVYQMSRENWTKETSSGQKISQADVAVNESIIFFTLQYLREINIQYTNVIMPLALNSLHENFNESEKILKFREKLNQQYIALNMLHQVIDKDLDKTLTSLYQKREDNQLRDWVDELIEKNLLATSKKYSETTKNLDQALNDFTEEDLGNYQEIKQEYQKSIKDVSLLYHPDLKKYKNVAGVLSIVGNLSWGLVNTLIGGGIALSTAVVSPFTRYVDFPRFRISASGEQIYVNVSGMSPIPGKMSLGLFEIDNFAGYTFASNHEAGHARQSAVLGPFYLPMVLISYAIQGHSHSFMEHWADRWSPGGHFHGH